MMCLLLHTGIGISLQQVALVSNLDRAYIRRGPSSEGGGIYNSFAFVQPIDCQVISALGCWSRGYFRIISMLLCGQSVSRLRGGVDLYLGVVLTLLRRILHGGGVQLERWRDSLLL